MRQEKAFLLNKTPKNHYPASPKKEEEKITQIED